MKLFYSFFIIFVLTLLICPIKSNSNGMKKIHFKVLWSIFEENADKISAHKLYYKTSPLNRFQITLYRHNEGHELSSFLTQKYDINSVDIDESEQFIDVEVRLDMYGSKTVTKFEKLEYEEGKIFVLPFHEKFQLPVLSFAYDESIFSKPIRHLQFNFSILNESFGPIQIRPISIECWESDKKIWLHYFVDGENELLIPEVVCDFDKYVYTYEVVRYNQFVHRPRTLKLDEPIYELGFVNRYEIVHNMEGKVVSYGLKKRVDQIDVKNTNFANKIPFFIQFIEEIGKIREIYLMQKVDKMTPEAAFDHVKATGTGSAHQQNVLLPVFGRPEEEGQHKRQKEENIGQSGQNKRQKVHARMSGHAQHHGGETGGSAPRQQHDLLELPSQPDENMESQLEMVRKEIDQTERIIIDKDETIKKAYEERAKACESLECLKKIAEELEQKKNGKAKGPN